MNLCGSISLSPSDGNYSTLVQSDGEVRLLTYQLGQIERMIANQLNGEEDTFIRIGKCLIINRHYIYYINVSKQQLMIIIKHSNIFITIFISWIVYNTTVSMSAAIIYIILLHNSKN